MRGNRKPSGASKRNDIGRTIEEIVLARRTFPWLYPEEVGGASGPSLSRPVSVAQVVAPTPSSPLGAGFSDIRPGTVSSPMGTPMSPMGDVSGYRPSTVNSAVGTVRRLRTRGRPRSQQLPSESAVMRLHAQSMDSRRRQRGGGSRGSMRRHGSIPSLEAGTFSPGFDTRPGTAASYESMGATPSNPEQLLALTAKAEELAARLQAYENDMEERKAAGKDVDGDGDDLETKARQAEAEAEKSRGGKVRREVPGEGYGLDVDHTLLSLGTTISRLDRVFHEQDGEAIVQEQSANVINALARRFIVRCKYLRTQEALNNQRMRCSTRFVRVIQNFVEREKMLSERMDLLHLMRSVRAAADHFKAWLQFTKDQRPTREARIRRAMEQSLSRVTRLLRTIMLKWRAIACGDRSRKKVAARYKLRVDAAREKLRTEGTHGIITPDLVLKALRIQAVQHMRERKRFHIMRIVYRAWFTDGMEALTRKKRRAQALFNRHLIRRVFPLWVKTHKRLVMGSYQKEWEGLVRWEKPVNQRRIRLHCDLAIEKRHFRHWAEHVRRRGAVRKRYQESVTHLCRKVFVAFTTRVQFEREVKRTAIEEWRAYGVRLQLVPFQAWYVWTHRRRTKKRAQNTLIFAYRRRRNRSLSYQCFRAWRYQVLYGRIEAMHTKIELIQALEEQKSLTGSLEDNLRRYKESVESMQISMDQQEEVLHKSVLEAEKRDQEMTGLKFAIHNSEQEIVRLRSQLDAAEMIHPGTIRRLRETGENDLDFEERELDPLARSRNERQIMRGGAADDLVPSDDDDPLQLGGGTTKVNAEEADTLDRCQWVKRRLDLLVASTPAAPIPPPLPEQLHGPVDPDVLRLMKRAEHTERTAATAVGLLHFLLTGENSLLPDDMDASDEDEDSVIPNSPAIDQRSLADPEARAYFDKTQFGKPRVPRADLGKGLSWADFLSAVRVRFPTRGEPSGGEMLGRTVFEAKRHAMALKHKMETEEKEAINMYSRAPQLVSPRMNQRDS